MTMKRVAAGFQFYEHEFPDLADWLANQTNKSTALLSVVVGAIRNPGVGVPSIPGDGGALIEMQQRLAIIEARLLVQSTAAANSQQAVVVNVGEAAELKAELSEAKSRMQRLERELDSVRNRLSQLESGAVQAPSQENEPIRELTDEEANQQWQGLLSETW